MDFRLEDVLKKLNNVTYDLASAAHAQIAAADSLWRQDTSSPHYHDTCASTPELFKKSSGKSTTLHPDSFPVLLPVVPAAMYLKQLQNNDFFVFSPKNSPSRITLLYQLWKYNRRKAFPDLPK